MALVALSLPRCVFMLCLCPAGLVSLARQDILCVPSVAGVCPPNEYETFESQQVASDCLWSDPARDNQVSSPWFNEPHAKLEVVSNPCRECLEVVRCTGEMGKGGGRGLPGSWPQGNRVRSHVKSKHRSGHYSISLVVDEEQYLPWAIQKHLP